MQNLKTLKQIFEFIFKQKTLIIAPIVIVLLILAVLILLGSSSAAAPFIYTLF